MKQVFGYIRYSSDKQEGNDSVHRQRALIESYASKNSLNVRFIIDEGVSAFNNDNIRVGGLGGLLSLIGESDDLKGSMLLVENLDRLSRKTPIDAIAQLNTMLEGSLSSVITLMDEKVYTWESIRDPMNFIQMSFNASNAFMESQKKSERVSKAWQHRRELQQQQIIISPRKPQWLDISKDGKKYIPNKMALDIKTIYELCLEGYGFQRIAEKLDFKYNPKQVANLLSHKTRTVLGELHPHKRVGKEKIPVGEPIRNYYPAIIEEDLFYRVQAKKQGFRASGPQKKHLNLFTSLAKCSVCGANMVVMFKSKENIDGIEKPIRYLACSNSTTKVKCKYRGVRLTDFENSFLKFFKELDVSSIIRSDNQQKNEIGQMRKLIKDLTEKDIALNLQIDNLFLMSMKATNPQIIERVTKEMDISAAKQAEVKKEIEAIKIQLANMSREQVTVEQQVEKLNELAQHITDIDARFSLRKQIQDLITEIKIYAHGLQDKEFCVTQEGLKLQDCGALKHLRTLQEVGHEHYSDLELQKEIEKAEKDLKKYRKEIGKLQFYVIKFRNGNERVVSVKDGMLSETIGNLVSIDDLNFPLIEGSAVHATNVLCDL